MYKLRGGFLVRPLTIALALGAAGAFLSWLEETVRLGAQSALPLARRSASGPGHSRRLVWPSWRTCDGPARPYG